MLLPKAGSAAHESLYQTCPGLLACSAAAVRQRWLLVARLNVEAEPLLSLAHSGWSAMAHTLGARLCALRALVFPEVKERAWKKALPGGPTDQGVVKDGVAVRLNRYEAEEARERLAGGGADMASHFKGTLFYQLFAQLNADDPLKLRRRDRGFKVRFVGEAADDYGGPYREAVTDVCAELQAASSALLLLCPNGKHGLGDNRSAFVPRPAAASAAELRQFHFLGKLMGCALLQSQMVLDLELAPHVWKRLAGITALDAADLSAFDAGQASSLARSATLSARGSTSRSSATCSSRRSRRR